MVCTVKSRGTLETVVELAKRKGFADWKQVVCICWKVWEAEEGNTLRGKVEADASLKKGFNRLLLLAQKERSLV